jgi:hypothetical protein
MCANLSAGNGFNLCWRLICEADYYYEIVHCDYNWIFPISSEYLQGFDNQKLQDYDNSFNALQLYSPYTLSIPNKNFSNY